VPTMTRRRIGYKVLGVLLLLACLPLDINTSLGLTIAMTLTTVAMVLLLTL
jgi:hypothetical protein